MPVTEGIILVFMDGDPVVIERDVDPNELTAVAMQMWLALNPSL